MVSFDDIDNAKHIVIRTDSNAFANANALYSYILSRHKKVSLVVTEEIDMKFSFLPWYAKQKDKLPISCDLVIESQSDTIALFKVLKSNGIAINQKMATSLFAGLLTFTEGFLGVTSGGIAFAIASELIECKAQHLVCKEFLQKRESLALFRLRALVYKNMVQTSNAEVINMYISHEDLQRSGATQKEVHLIQKELLKMVHVKEVRLYRWSDNKILKTIKEI